MTKILVVEDESSLAQSLLLLLQKEAYSTLLAIDLAQARQLIQEQVDLVILDWSLPDGQGIDLLRQWRDAGIQIPVIFLTARTELIDRVLGLEMGANDYVTKPFETRELLARIKVQLRQITPGQRKADKLERAGISLDPLSREVFFKNEAQKLTHMEFSLLKFFFENPNKVFTREELLVKVWGYDSYPTTRTVDNHIVLLRQKFGAELFETVRKVGYRFID